VPRSICNYNIFTTKSVHTISCTKSSDHQRIITQNEFLISVLTHWGPVTQICVFCIFSLQLWKTDDANLRCNTHLVFTHLITQYMELFLLVLWARCLKKGDFTLIYRFVIKIEEKIPVRNVLILVTKFMPINNRPYSSKNMSRGPTPNKDRTRTSGKQLTSTILTNQPASCSAFLTTNHEVQGSIPGSTTRIFPWQGRIPMVTTVWVVSTI
jgi:hypothetical protein